ncbi:T9SS C-terminal target domain-containing protein [Sphingobacteriales bacterium UPWRP_1]|nr:hypothetical protein BVG80_15255 [Sphingobacteriales bacterium TSM_CSM]PSJ79104.1 T9SS C-terminal target domain-containing protein [Sphingobacteriales bacterium UPWRP_1]
MKTPLFFLLMLLVVMPAMAQTILFEDDFEMANFKPQWTPIPGVPNGIVDIANGWGFDDSRGARLGKSSSAGGYVSNALDLHLNLAGQTQVAMTFKIGDVADETDYDDAIFFSNNGGLNFERVFVFEPSDWCDQYGQFPPLDIDQLAAQNGLTLTSQFVIRFQQHGEDYLPYYDGFYLDDVRVYVPDLTYAPLPFTDTFETGAFGSMWTWSFADQTNSLADIPTRPSNLVDIATAIGFNSSRGVRMGKTCSDGPATNALDLHLNLAGQTQVAMTFKIRDVADETDYDDAIYFSNNGGITFEKVYSFVWGATADVYTDYNLNISNLAATNGLALTNQFVIRFQQYGEDYLPYYDGIYLDNVQVTGTSTGIESTAANPAQDLLLVYPNPAGSWLHLNTAIPHLQEGGIIQIFSATGQLALQHTPGVAGGGNPVAIDHLAPGLYFVQLTTPQGNYCQRMVKQ